MGLLDMIIGWFFFTQIWGLLSTIPRRGVFLPQIRCLLCSVPRRGVLFSFLRILAPKGHIWSKRIISGPDFLKNVDMLSDVIIFRVPSFRFP